MIRLAFLASQRKIIKFEIENQVIRYFDDMWKEGIQIMPKDQNLIERLRRSGKQSLKMMAALILDANKGANLKEYLNCNSEEELAEFVRKDCLAKGLKELK